MFQLIRAAGGIGLLVSLVAVFGCSAGVTSDKMIVKGKVTIDDKPAEGVTIAFYGPSDKAASGIVNTQADGTYEVMFNTAAGEGNYKVTATKINARPGIQSGPGIDDFQMKLASGGGSASALPAKYGDVNTSGLSTPLQKGPNEGKNFALKSK